MRMITAFAPSLGRVPARKLFYRIQEVSKLTGLKPYVLRYWETEFKELAPGKDASDQRRYRQADIEVILAIRKLLYEDRFTIEGARKRLKDELRRVRGEVASEPEPGGRQKGTRGVASEKLPLEDFIPAPLREAASRAQKQARQSKAVPPRRAAVMRDGAAEPLDENQFELRAAEGDMGSMAAPSSDGATQFFDTPAARPSASIISITPTRDEAAAMAGMSEDEMAARRLESVLGQLRAEVNDLLEYLS